MACFRWGTYERISDDRVGAGLGVQRQRKDIRQMIGRDDPGGVVVDDYPDNDISAYSGKRRPAYERLLADIRVGRVNAIGAWHNDRLHRSPAELEEFIKLVEQHGVHIATVKAGPMDLDTPTGRLVARTLGGIARFESEHKAERIRSKHLELAEAGKLSGGGYRLYGWKRIYDREELPHKIIREEVVPEEAAVIQEAARRILRGDSVYGVVDDLNARGVRTVTGGRWYRTSLVRVLVAARTAGQREHRPGKLNGKVPLIGDITGPGQWDDGTPWPAILTPAQSDQLRRMLADPRRRTTRGPIGTYLCAGGILICGLCGEKMVGRTRPSSGRSQYFCAKVPGKKGCGRTAIVGTETEYVVTGWVSARISMPAFRKALQKREAGPTESAVMEDMRQAEQQQKDLAAMWAEGKISRTMLLEAEKGLRERIERDRHELSRNSATAVLDGLPADEHDLQAFLLDAEVPVPRRRAVLKTLLESVTVTPAARAGRQPFDPGRLTPKWKV